MDFTFSQSMTLFQQTDTTAGTTTDSTTVVPRMTTTTISISSPISPAAKTSETASLSTTEEPPTTSLLSTTEGHLSSNLPTTDTLAGTTDSPTSLTSILKSSSTPTSLTSSASSIFTMTSQTTVGTTVTSDLTTLASTTSFSSAVSSAASSNSSTFIHSTVTTMFSDVTFPNTTAPLNISEEERQAYLDFLQDETTKVMIPAMTYLIILGILGVIGNSLVLFVYSHKFKRTPTRIFIMAIAMFDLVTNIAVMPGEIYDMFHVWDFNFPRVCGLRLFFNAFTTMASAMVLVAVAGVRYQKICRPFGKQVNIKKAKIMCVTLAIASLIFSIPYGIINGRRTRPTPRPGIHGYECTIDDSYANTIWPLLNSGFFILLFISCGIPLVVLYILIGIQAWRHSRVYGVASFSNDRGKYNTDTTESSSGTGKHTKSTTESVVKMSISSKTRSYVKKKSDSDTTAKVEPKKDDPVSVVEENNDGCNVIELIDDEKEDNEQYNNNNYSTRMIRAPTGQKANINLCMVRELTVKLKAVQKETERNEKESEEGPSQNGPGSNLNSSPSKDSVDENGDGKICEESVELKTASSEKLDKTEASDKGDSPLKADGGQEMNDDSSHRVDKELEDKTSSDGGQEMNEDSSHRVDKELEDKTSSETPQNTPATQKRVDFYTGSKENVAAGVKDTNDKVPDQTCPELEKTEGGECGQVTEGIGDEPAESTDERVSEFAKAMEWVDITYCLKDGQNEKEQTEEGTEEEDTNRTSKKGSISLSRKVSRDNSFLQKHRKLRGVLTDTLSRARKNIREREAAEAEAKNGQDIGTVEADLEEGAKPENGNGDNDKKGGDKADVTKEDQRATGHSESQTKITLKTPAAKRKGIGRTTAMLIIISAVYILGFLPFLGLAFFNAFAPEAVASMGVVSLSLYNLFLRSYFLNSAANPIIYSLCDVNFRKECFKLLRC